MPSTDAAGMEPPNSWGDGRSLPSMDLVCVTFEGDARLNVLQVLSVERLFDHSGIGTYFIILNGVDNKSLREFFSKELRGRVSPELEAKMVFREANDVLGGHEGIGRRNQQLLKLMIAREVTSETYLLLDAKNHFIRHSSRADFFHSGMIKTVRSKPSPALFEYAVASLQVFGAAPQLVENALPTITPYVMVTSEVLDLIRRIEKQFNKSFLESFDEDLRSTTEFFLYYSHLVTNGRPLSYVAAPPLVTTLFTQWPQDPAVVMRLITDAERSTRPLFGLHRLRLPQLTAEQSDAIARLWRIGLLESQEDEAWFLETV